MSRESVRRIEAPLSPRERAYYKTRRYFEGHDLSDVRIGYASDGEGPQFCGDTAADALNRVFPGTVTAQSGEMTRGHFMHQQIGTWFDVEMMSQIPQAQVGTGVVLGVPLLVASGATDRDMVLLANTSSIAPGSDAWRKHMKENNGHILCVTTASEVHHRPLGRKLGLDGLVGTELSLDCARDAFEADERGEQELTQAQCFIEDSMTLMDRIDTGVVDASAMRGQVRTYYRDVVGVGTSGTIAAQQIERAHVMGSHGKRGAAQAYFEALPTDAVKVAIGDGTNDSEMLRWVPNSIGMNGWQAATSANFGLITADMSVMATLGEILSANNPEETRDYYRVIKTANGTNAFKQAHAILHPGGRLFGEQLPQRLVIMHNEARRAVRGAVGMALI